MVKPILPLAISSASVHKKGNRLVGPIDANFGVSGLTVFIGPNGSGKTTLLRLMHGLERPSKGKLNWNTDADNIYRRQSFVFQSPIMMHRTVLENVAYPLLVRGAGKDGAAKKSETFLNKVGLEVEMGRRATSLSGGEKQKLAIARALVTDPEILFLDEPTTNLDGQSVRDIETIVRNVADDGTRVMMATHDMAQAQRLADDAVFLYRGVVHEIGSADTLLNKPATKEAKAFLKGEILI